MSNAETKFNEENFKRAFPDIPLSKDQRKIQELNNIVVEARRELNKLRRHSFLNFMLALSFGALCGLVAAYLLIPGAC